MKSSIALYITRFLPYILIAVLLFNMVQRRYMKSGMKKRYATLYLAGLLLLLLAVSFIIIRFDLGDIALLPSEGLLAYVAYRFRSRIFLFRRKCAHCGCILPLFKILFADSNLCTSCEHTNSV